MSGGVVMYGAPGVPGWPKTVPTVPVYPVGPAYPAPADSAGRILDFIGTPKRSVVVSARKTKRGLAIKVTVDGVLVSETLADGASAVLTVAV